MKRSLLAIGGTLVLLAAAPSAEAHWGRGGFFGLGYGGGCGGAIVAPVPVTPVIATGGCGLASYGCGGYGIAGYGGYGYGPATYPVIATVPTYGLGYGLGLGLGWGLGY